MVFVEINGEPLKGNEDTNHYGKVASYFDKVGQKVLWEKLAAEIEDETFRVQVLD